MLPYTNRSRGRDNKESMELERSCTYDLLSVVVHVGEIDTGHYVSYCRVGDQVSRGFAASIERPELT
jgi:ubiquitin carboxyl-terminal hydrolase 22/27/51